MRAPRPGVFSSASVSAASDRAWRVSRTESERQYAAQRPVHSASAGATDLVANLREVGGLAPEDVRHLGLAH